jgi:diaminopimelate epimerase
VERRRQPIGTVGNGLRCLAALVAKDQALGAGTTLRVDTGAGAKTLDILTAHGSSFEFRTQMGQPDQPPPGNHRGGRPDGHGLGAGMGNPSVRRPRTAPDQAAFDRLGPALSTHPMFPRARTSSSPPSRRRTVSAS